MSDPAALLDPFVRGITVGAMAVTAFSVWRSPVSRDARIVTLLFGLGVIGWVISESTPLWSVLDRAYPFVFAAYPTAGLFWLFVTVVFEDRPVTWPTLTPPLALLVSGVVMGLAPPTLSDIVWTIRNIAGVLLGLHAGVIILRGWRDDLLEARRRQRGLLLGLATIASILEVVVVFAHRLDPQGPWLLFSAAQIYGICVLAVLALAMAGMFLQAQPAVFGASRRPEAGPDARAETADRLTLEKLQAQMAAEGWRREGLTIGALANDLDIPEHRLRRLINQRLGHRNFAEYVNSHRIDAAKRRLADPAEARTTVAAIAFDLGYGSLGPFNRAFRTATGATPSEWRRQALAQASPELEQAV